MITFCHLHLQTTMRAALTFLWPTENLGRMLKIIAGTYHLILSAYSQQKRMRQCTTLPACKLCGSASSKIVGGGPTAVARPSATGGGLSPTTSKIRTASLPYLCMKESGTTYPALANAGSSAKGVSWCWWNLCKTEAFIACVLSPSLVTLAAMKYSSTTSPAATTTAVAPSSSSSSLGIITYHFTVTDGPSTTQRFTSGLTTVSPSTVTTTSEPVLSTSTADISDASSATSATTTLATPVETPIQPTTSSTTVDSGDKNNSPPVPFAFLQHEFTLWLPGLCCLP